MYHHLSNRYLADMVGSAHHQRNDHHSFPWQEQSLARATDLEYPQKSPMGCQDVSFAVLAFQRR
jgi:hypothetical protein